MANWSSGYVADIGYTYGAYSELNPQHARLALLNAGLALPENGTACELGFGQGLSVNVHAAASATQWYGTDFNPVQAGFAQELAKQSGADVKLYDQAFAEFCARTDLPDFDYIALHGIWSWVSDDARHTIVDFVRRKLKVGGVLYVSYNVLQGWAGVLPVRELMMEHSKVMAASGKNMAAKVEESLAFVDRLLGHSPIFAGQNPTIRARLDSMKPMNKQYLAHEYFNSSWAPMSFSSMASWLESAKLDFACSANHLDQLTFLYFTPEQIAMLNEVEDVGFRETVRDFMTNQQFRRDYWVKGARKLGAQANREAWLAQRVVLLSEAAGVSMQQKTARGSLNLQKEIYQPIIDLLADNRARTIAQIVEHCAAANEIPMAQILQAIHVLAGCSVIALAQEPDLVALAKPRTERLNRHICTLALDSDDVRFLASPVTGGAVQVDRIEQLCLLARSRGGKAREDWVQFVQSALKQANQKLTVEGQPELDDQQQIERLRQLLEDFESRRLPLLMALGVDFQE